VIGINVIMLALREIPLVGYTVSPQKDRRGWSSASGVRLSRDGGKNRAGHTSSVLGLALIGRGIAGLLS
jgi:hypothetical protein